MRETRSSGSVEGVMSNRDPYSDSVRYLALENAITSSHAGFADAIVRVVPSHADGHRASPPT